MNKQTELPLNDAPVDHLSTVVEVLKVMSRLRLDIERALCYGGNTHNFDDVVSGLLRGSYIPHYTHNSMVLCEVVTYPRKKFYHVFLAAGNLDGVLSVLNDMYRMAERLHCNGLVVVGRPGWTRVLKTHGWDIMLTQLGREV